MSFSNFSLVKRMSLLKQLTIMVATMVTIPARWTVNRKGPIRSTRITMGLSFQISFSVLRIGGSVLRSMTGSFLCRAYKSTWKRIAR